MNQKFSNIKDIIVDAGKRYGEKDAFRYKVKNSDGNEKKTAIESKSYTQLMNDAGKCAAAFSELFENKSHIAIIGPTSYSWIVTFMGTTCSRNVAVPIDALLSADEVCDLLDRADVSMLVFDKSKEEIAAAAKEKCDRVKYFVSMDKESNIEGALSFWNLLEGKEPDFSHEIDPDELATIMFTSGTTGKSKGVMLTHRNMAENATCQDMGFEEGTVILSVLPIHHAYCLNNDILQALSLGCVICINDSLLRVAKNLKLFEPNVILMVPLMIETFCKKLEEVSLIPAPILRAKVFGKQLHTIISGGAYLNPAYVDTFKKFGITILQGYGMTECSPVISTNLRWDNRQGSVGKLLPNCEAKVVDEELWVKGSSVMQGYYKMPEETAQTLEDGWLKTGDLGYVDDDGFVYLTGRKKNLIITKNGENVSPEEIENKIGEERLVQEIIVREDEGVIEAEIFPDYEYATKKKIKDIPDKLQKIIDKYNEGAPTYKRVLKLKVRDAEFEKNTTRKIKRF